MTIVTTGRPVFVGLIADGTADASWLGTYSVHERFYSGSMFYICRDSSVTAVYQVGGLTYNSLVQVPSSGLCVIDLPPAGTHAYKVQMLNGNGASHTYVNSAKLIAFEL